MTDSDTPNCAMCGGRRIEGSTTFSTDLGFGVVVVRHVPAVVCEQCGEEWIADETARRLEDVTDRARQTRHLVEILPY